MSGLPHSKSFGGVSHNGPWYQRSIQSAGPQMSVIGPQRLASEGSGMRPPRSNESAAVDIIVISEFRRRQVPPAIEKIACDPRHSAMKPRVEPPQPKGPWAIKRSPPRRKTDSRRRGGGVKSGGGFRQGVRAQKTGPPPKGVAGGHSPPHGPLDPPGGTELSPAEEESRRMLGSDPRPSKLGPHRAGS